jgi:succinoglycan biosynthesis transport protein ExoP
MKPSNEPRALAIPAASAPLGAPDVIDRDGQPVASQRENLWHVIDSRLNGRWKWMLVLGVGLAAVFAPLGYFGVRPTYESRGLVRVAPKLDYVIRETQETELMPLYTQFVQTQAQLIASEWVLQSALKDPAMREVPWATSSDALDRIAAGLSVDAPRQSQLITVSYEAESGRVAEACVNSILRAFGEASAVAGGSSVAMRLDTLQRLRTQLNTDIHEKRKELQSLPSVTRFAATDLDLLLQAKQTQMERYRQELDALRISLAVTPVRNGASTERPTGASLTATQLDRIDPQVADLRRTVEARRLAFAEIQRQYRPGSRPYVKAENELDAAEELLLRREEAVREQYDQTGGMIADSAGDNSMLTPEQMAAKQGAIEQLRSALEEDIKVISADRLRAAAINTEIADLQRELGEVDNRIKEIQIETESADRARVSVFQWGVRPSSPAHDRRKVLAAMGLMGGFGASFLLFFVMGAIDRRAFQSRHIGDAGGLRPLGVLPDLGASAADPESSEMAAHCVHQIRNLIEASRNDREPVVLAISSPFQGDGKTSFTLALGFSYAAAGNRTIVVDGDVIGRGLTRQLSLVGLPGFKECVRDGALRAREIDLGERGRQTRLHALPVGVETTMGPEAVRKRDVESLVADLRAVYDVVLIDTGPVLGSLESVPVCSSADGVVMVVRRGRRRGRLEEAAAYLASVGARTIGVVLNCAARSECYRYTSEQSLAPTRAELDAAAAGARAPSGRRHNALVAALEEPDDSHAAA